MCREASLETLRKIGSELVRISQISALLGWDQETYMPREGIEDRAVQQALISGWQHDKLTDPEIGKALEALGVDLEVEKLELTQFDSITGLNEQDRAFIREMARNYRREKKLPKSLVEKFARETSISQSKWVEAREKSDFDIFAPHLERILSIEKEMAGLIGYDSEPYDALLDTYEPWMSTKELVDVFDRFEAPLKDLVKRIVNSHEEIDERFIHSRYNIRKQEAFGKEILEAMGFDFNRGRLDVSAHPFTTTIGFSDVRLTTRYSEDNLKDAIFGIIHEGGHGLYELGFSGKLKGNILADGASMGIHESQSRLWENIIGRSYNFWVAFYPKLTEYFEDTLKGVPLESFYRAINVVKPSLIRVMADEVTYNLHILVRFKIERGLLNNEISVNELPRVWNDEYEYLLGVRPENDSEGVLQDIHWSLGYIGYFPTYSLGNLYSAQFYAKMRKYVENLDEEIRRGNLRPVLAWLRENIHQYGKVYPASVLCKRVTGESLNPRYFIDYLEDKYSAVYGLG